MVWQKPSYFTQLARSYPILRFVDIYDRQSFIRAYVLDNIFVCIFVYVLLYVALWYANKAIRKIEKSNEELSAVVKENQMQLDDLVVLKRKKAEYEDVVIKVKGAQKVTAEQLEIEMKKLSAELLATANKMNELEKIVEKCERSERSCDLSSNVGAREYEDGEEAEESSKPYEKFKILEPSFPPPVPPEPPPRKYGIFATQPQPTFPRHLFLIVNHFSTPTETHPRCPMIHRMIRKKETDARFAAVVVVVVGVVVVIAGGILTRDLTKRDGPRSAPCTSRQGQRASNVPLACKGILGVLTFDDRVHPQGFSSFLFLFFFFFFFFLFSFTQNGIKMVMDTSTVRLVIFLGMFLVFAGDYSIFIPSIFGKDVEKNLTDPSKGPVGPPREGSSEKLAIASSKKKEIERDSAIARRAKMMTTIKTACLPKLICELTSSVRQDQLSEMERSLLNLIRDTSLSTIAEVPSRYHFAAHMGQLISGMEGQGCHNFYPTCPLPGASVLNMMKKVRLR
ncbi:hypothetical protein KPH14_004661 [Odynerus spinipes]|uniref:Uncharacterized protein n=1 Tax=Odynerus spinipes TaxID=1348599 RepID=A0AAD9RNA6_9HYME|nr:hypothetical protein KPH14_004661 [Odynerus spinipes]